MNRCVHVVCCVACLLVPNRAAADISIKLSNKDLTTRSDLIVIGRALDSSPRWIGRMLVTAVKIEVRESLKGSGSTVVEVLLPGGIDLKRRVPIGMAVAGAPRIQRNDDMILFLSRDPSVGGYILTGFAQGKFSIITQQGRQTVSRDARGSQLVEGASLSRGTATMTPLADFRREIATYIAR